MKVLFIGGTGVISSACTNLCVEMGIELHLLNRGKTDRSIPKGVNIIIADVRDPEGVRTKLQNETYDVVVDWIAFNSDHVRSDFDIFKDKTSQYIFISSASAYQKPASSLPIRESEPLINSIWEYSQHKIYCEEYLMNVYREYDFPVTIVRPSHTYDRTKIALSGGYTTLNRIQNGKKIIIHGDGTSLWTLTHHEDFARGFVGLLGNSNSIGEAFHITSDEILTWNQICETFAEAVSVDVHIVHIPSDFIHQYDKEWGDGLLGDKAHCMIFDNSKIKKFNPGYQSKIPFKEGAKEIVAWYNDDPARKVIDSAWESKIEEIINKYESLLG